MIKNGKIFGKINIFDFIVLILVILLLVGAFAFFGLKSLKSGNNTQLKEITYKIVLEDVRAETVNSFEPGQIIFGNSSKKQIGLITAVESKDAVTVMETLNGKLINAPVEDKYDLTLTMRAVVKTSEGADMWFSSEDRVLDGQHITFITQKNKCYGATKDVTVVNELGSLTEKFEAVSERYYLEGIES